MASTDFDFTDLTLDPATGNMLDNNGNVVLTNLGPNSGGNTRTSAPSGFTTLLNDIKSASDALSGAISNVGKSVGAAKANILGTSSTGIPYMPLLMVGGAALAAYLLLRKK